MILGFIFDSILSLDLEISSLGGLQNGGTIKRFDKKDILNGHQLLSIRSEIDDQKCFLYLGKVMKFQWTTFTCLKVPVNKKNRC